MSGHRAANFWEWFQLAAWDVKGFFGNKDAKIHAESLRQVNSQKTEVDREIYKTVTEARVKFGGIVGVVQGLFKSAGQGLDGLFKMLSFVLRFFPVILIVGFLLYLVFVVKIIPKAKAVTKL
jgi:hypothetical protein